MRPLLEGGTLGVPFEVGARVWIVCGRKRSERRACQQNIAREDRMGGRVCGSHPPGPGRAEQTPCAVPHVGHAARCAFPAIPRRQTPSVALAAPDRASRAARARRRGPETLEVTLVDANVYISCMDRFQIYL